ncbi:hypothetical protein LTR56_015874 [Elasticomyces elasticus]|nr:hypothetical protein LTR56_015874 [Elasticomyces elasticus]KAK3640036.1 hypothetical protein LTR22_017194 [Elasticomyces elasticus]KAK4908226.1 hypothetical protein LTR49_022871 [Elasticomyces elasticus]KAK5754991.1 hypothetical protein LTS12_014907 [Elasticomyces elasticus]
MSSEIACDPAAPITGDWFFHDQQYWSWLGDGGTFSIVGRAGCGKSTLMQHIVKFEMSLQGMTVESGRHGPYPQSDILCFCFRGTQEEPELDMLRSLLHQMLCDNADFLGRFVTISGFEKRCRDWGDHGSKWDWTVSELGIFFPSLVEYARERYHVIHIFLDGVDERVVDVCQRLTGSISVISDSARESVGLCYSCRPNCDVDIRYDFRIDLEAHNRNDIAIYVHDQFMTRTRSGQITRVQGEIDSIMRALIKRTTSCFQWLVFFCPGVLRLAMSSESVDHIVSRIRGFSPALGDVYAYQIGSISLPDVPQVLCVFQWLLHGKDIFCAPVLRDAVCLEDGRRYYSPGDIKDSGYWCDDANVYADRAVRLTRNLIERRELKIKLDDGNTRIVQILQFDHDSVSEFLLEAGLRMLEARMPRHLPVTPLTKLESSIAGKCLSYLICCRSSRNPRDVTEQGQACDVDTHDKVSAFASFDEDSVPVPGLKRSIPFTFELYADIYWMLHVEAAEAAKDFESIVEVLDWIRCDDWSLVIPAHMTLVHMLCLPKLDRTLSFILDIQRDHSEYEAPYGRFRKQCLSELNSQIGVTPMVLAACFGRHYTVEILLEHGADPNLSDDAGWLHGRTLLYFVILTNFLAELDDYKDKIHMLIHSGKLETNAEDEDGRSVLFYACMCGDAYAVQSLLFSKKVDLGSRDRWGQTAIEVAIQWKRADIVKLFVDAKTGLNIKYDHDHDHGTALLALAAERGHSDIFELLLSSSRFDVCPCDDTESTGSCRAVMRVRALSVKLLLKADGVYCRECCGRTLLAAANGGKYDLMQTLVRSISDEFGHLQTVGIMFQHGIMVGLDTGPLSRSFLENADVSRLQIGQYLLKYMLTVRAVYAVQAPNEI